MTKRILSIIMEKIAYKIRKMRIDGKGICMTIKEASQKWGLTENTICKYIAKEWFDGIYCEQNRVLLPEIPKPYKTTLKGNETVERLLRTILKACNERRYLSAYMLGVSPAAFFDFIDTLKKEEMIEGEAQYGASNMGFKITLKGIKESKKKKLSSPVLNINVQVSDINAQLVRVNKTGMVNL